jgi:hypothetical protein
MVRFLRLDPHPGEHLCSAEATQETPWVELSRSLRYTTANPASAIARAQQQYVVAWRYRRTYFS